MKKPVLYYFSGTGNSLVVAQKIKERLENFKVIEISSALQIEKFECKAKIVGFVFPCHGFTTPIPVKRFIDKLQLKKANFVFAIVTRGGTAFRGFESIDKSLKKQGKKLNATFVIDMPSNDPKFENFVVPTYEEVEKYHDIVDKKISLLESAISKKEEYHDDVSGITMLKNKVLEKPLENIVSFSVHNIAAGTKKYFYTNDDCIGCKVCTKVCSSKKIEFEDGKPKWNTEKDCYMCYACLNFCPVEAIQIHSKPYMKSFTEQNGRYHHPHVTHKDMKWKKKVD